MAEGKDATKGTSLTQRVLRGSVLNLFEHVVRTAALLVVTPIMIQGLGLESYAIWLLLTAAISFLTLLDGGITLSGTRFLARALTKKDEPEAWAQTVGTLRWLYRWIGTACLVLTLGLWLAAPAIVKNPAWADTGRVVIAILGVSMALRFFMRLHLVILKAYVRYDLIVVSSLIKTAAQSALIICLIQKGHGLVVLALVQIGTDVLDQVIVVLFSRRTVGQRLATAVMHRPMLPELLKFSAMNLLNTLGQHLRTRIDPFVIKAFVGLNMIPVYNRGLVLLTMFSDVINAVVGGTLLAGFSQVEGRAGLEGLRHKFMLSMRLSIVLSFIGGAGLFIFGPSFLIRWLGPDFTQSGSVLQMLALPYTLWLAQFPTNSLFLSLNRHHLLTKLTFVAGVFNLTLSVILASKIGFYGVVWATLIDMTLFYGLLVPWLASRVLEIPLMDYFKLLLTPFVLLSLPTFGFYSLIQSHLKPEYLAIIWQSAALCLLLGVCGMFLLTGEERTAIMSRLGVKPKTR
ncbi:MAG: oligosaccharide flippase family protein [Verrucomicrobiaceae bacterium]|nr:oligosaccharide flippase family protein [Verrucomicrobiaceae bacterium]